VIYFETTTIHENVIFQHQSTKLGTDIAVLSHTASSSSR